MITIYCAICANDIPDPKMHQVICGAEDCKREWKKEYNLKEKLKKIRRARKK